VNVTSFIHSSLASSLWRVLIALFYQQVEQGRGVVGLVATVAFLGVVGHGVMGRFYAGLLPCCLHGGEKA
jgi:hypothetical protein